MHDPEESAVALASSSKMDWRPVRLVLMDSLSYIGPKGVALLATICIATAAVGLQVAWLQDSPDLGGYYNVLTLLALIFFTVGFTIARRDRTLWPILPLNREHRAMLKWLRLVLFPWLAVLVFISVSMVVVSVLWHSKSPFPNLTMTLMANLCLIGIAQVIVIASYINNGINRFVGKFFDNRFVSIARILIITVIMYILGLYLYKLKTLVLATPSLPMLVGLFFGSAALLGVSYWMRMLAFDEQAFSIHPNTNIICAKRPNKPMPVNSVMGSVRRRFLVSVFAHIVLPLVLLQFIANNMTWVQLFVLLFLLVAFCRPITLTNARELRMLPMSRLYKAWISGWGALVQTVLQLTVAIIACNVMRSYRGNFDDPWGGNVLGIVLLTSAAALLVRPLIMHYIGLREKNNAGLKCYFVSEYALSFLAIGAIYGASVPVKGIPLVPLINNYSSCFTSIAVVWLIIASVLAIFLMRNMWDWSSLYRRAPQGRI